VQIREKLARRAKKSGLSLPEAAFSTLEAYFELLRKWNRKVSLTSLPVAQIEDEAVDRLLVEPCLAARYLPSGSVVIDLGSGGGSPAIPMRIVSPTISMLMVESKSRKAAFLREAIRHLDLSHTEVELSRFEELLVKPHLRGCADVVTVRAVRLDGKALAAISLFLKPDGALFLFTSASSNTDSLFPQLSHRSVHNLIPELGSSLQVLSKSA
jgi:16S rRNA (guanine527-N7)-methyltransferase